MKRLLLLANLLAIAALAGVVAFAVVSDRARVIAQAEREAVNLRDALAEHTRQTFAALDIALLGVAEGIPAEEFDSTATHLSLAARNSAIGGAYALYILDVEGRLAARATPADPEPVDQSAHETFQHHRDDSSRELHVAAPRAGRVGDAENQWIVNVSRRLTDAEGNFAGVAAAAVSVQRLVAFYDALRSGGDDAVGLFRSDATLLARSPMREEFLGRRLDDTILFRDLLPKAERGLYSAPFVTDGAERVTAYARIPGYPFVVYVGIGTDDRLAAWRQRAMMSSGLGLFAALLTIGLSVALLRNLRERQQANEFHSAQLMQLTEVSSELVGSSGVQEALQRLTARARELVPAHQAVTSLTAHPSMAQAIHTVSLSEKYAAWRDYDEATDGSGIYRLVCERNAPMRLTQAELVAHPDWKGFGAARDRHPPMRGWLAAPLMAHDGSNLGLIQLSDRETGEFTAEDEALLVQLAHAASVAVQRLNLDDELRLALAEAERQRRTAEQALFETEKATRKIETIFDSISDAVFMVDRDWRFTFLNSHAERLLERSADSIVGRSIWDEFPEVRDTVAFTEYTKAMETGVDVDFEFFYPPLDRWFDIKAYPHAAGLTVYFRDMTDWKAREEQLRQAQKMDAIGQLTGGVAHDFNNLLTVILGNAQMLLRGLVEGERPHRQASLIVTAAERAAALTQRLLAFSRRQPLDPSPTDVNALIEALEPLLARTIGEQFEIDFTLRPGLPPAMVDGNQLENAILNLAINARDAMPDGGRLSIETAETSISAEYVEQHPYAVAGRYVMIAVSDTGVGMSEEVRARVFEPFFTTKHTGAGTGLGLSMVYGFIRQSSGHVNIYSEPGQGTVVKMYLPCSDDYLSATGRTGESEASAQGGDERILVVEDDAMVREYTVGVLEGLGYRVVAAADGRAALEVLQEDRNFDMLLSDVILAGDMNGRQVAEEAGKIIPGLPVLFMSGYTENVIVHRGRLDAGAKLLMKPFRQEDLAQKLREVLDASR